MPLLDIVISDSLKCDVSSSQLFARGDELANHSDWNETLQ
jgi:hypothetical protein